MQRTSSAYRREQNLTFSGPVLMKITFGLVDADAAATSTVTATAGLPFSTPTTIVYEEGTPERVYATLEPGRMLADGRQLIPPRNTPQMQREGFVSTALSDGQGAFASPPTITIGFTKTHTVPALSFTFDRATGDYPAQLRIRAWRKGEFIVDKIVEPTSADYTADGEIERFDKLEISFLSTVKPYRRARLQQLMFGVGMMFDNRLIQSANQKLEVDPITRRLPQNTFSFSLVNTNLISGETQNLYDPDNPKGVWKYIEQRSPIKVEYGQQITQGIPWGDAYSQTWGDLELATWGGLMNGGFVEWMPGGRYYLNAAPTVNGLYAKFTAFDVMGLMGGSYYKGYYDGQPHSLYSLAEGVLLDAALPQIYADRPPWTLWEGLRDIYTTAPLPVKSHKELLQLIAHAACSVLYTDRDGILQIKPPPTEQYDLALSFDSTMGQPKATKIPTLYRVDCPVYSHMVEAESKELHSGEYWAEGETKLHISFGMAIVDNITVEGAELTEQQRYAQAVDLTITGSGTATVKIMGRGITTGKSLVSSVVPKGDENGVVEVLDNPLITAVNTAAAVANWVRDYLMYRTTYEFNSRGSPECDPLDIVQLESAFDSGFPAEILKNEVAFDGSISGKMICKKRVQG